MRQVISKTHKINEAELAELKKRVNIATLVILFFAMIIVVRLWFLQILRGPDYVKLSENNRIRMQWINAPRGNIWDRNGKEIITNRPFFNVTWVREDAPKPDVVLKKMAAILDVDMSELLDRIREGSDYPRYVPIRLKEDIDWKTLVYIENHRYDLPGIRIEVLPSRKYIHKNLASHTIGYLGRINRKELAGLEDENYQPNDHIGKLGIEKLFEEKLRGEKGQRYVEVDVQGFEQREIAVQEPLSGNDIKLTIDLDLQKTAEKALEGKGGAIVVMEVNTGRLLAFASSPPLELEEFIGGISQKAWDKMQQNIMHPFLNKTIQGQYPPASTYKLVTALAGLSENVINKETIFYCAGSMTLHGRKYHCWKRSGHGAVNLEQAIEQSCDVYFYQVGLKVGVDKLAKYARSLGLGSKTGIPLEHEKAGLVPTTDWKMKRRNEVWQEGETMSVAIGQGFNLATPLQISLMTATLANNGTRYRPQIIEAILDASGNVTEEFKPIVDGHMLGNPQALEYVKNGMLAVVQGEHGTARHVSLDNISVAGKTGTAQVIRLAKYRHVPEEDIPYKYRDHAWFTCFAPAEAPEVAVTVLVEHGLHGSSGAGPLAKEVLEAYFADRLQADQAEKTQ